MHETLELLILVLGAVQLIDILIAVVLYYIYNKNKDYLSVIFLWIGMFMFFSSEYLISGLSGFSPLYSFAFAIPTSLAMSFLIISFFKLSLKRERLIYFSVGFYFISLLVALIFQSFYITSIILAIGISAPVLYCAYLGFNSHYKRSILDKIFLSVAVLWAIHFLDYPLLRPLTESTFPVFGFSFALVLTYITSILVPVVINRHIYLDLNHILSDKLEERNAELQAAQEKIISKEKLASLGNLSAGIAHEIKNPLNIIKNGTIMSQKIIKDLSKDHELDESCLKKKEKLDQLSEMINRNVDRANSIIKNMLLQSRSGEATLSEVNLDKLLKETFDFVMPSVKVKYNINVEFEWDLNSKSLINIYLQEVSRVLVNILENSYYALEEKKQHFPDYQPKISFKTFDDDSYVFVIIKDNGIGIDSEILPKILEPFYSSKPPGDGTGLGLSLVYDVIKMHLGELDIKSEKNLYTEITLKISKHL